MIISVEIPEDHVVYEVVKDLEAAFNRPPEWLVVAALNNLHIRMFPEQYPGLFDDE